MSFATPPSRSGLAAGGSATGAADAVAATCVGTFKGHTSLARAVAWVGDGRIVSASHDKTLKLWSVADQRLLGTFIGHTDAVNGVCWLKDGRMVSGGRDWSLRVWDIATQTCLGTMEGHQGWITDVICLGGSQIVSCSWDKTLKLWDVDTRLCLGSLSGHTGHVYSATLLRDGRIISASEDTTLRLWSVSTLSCLSVFSGHTDKVHDVAQVGIDRMVSASADGTLKLWDISTANALDTTLRVWDLSTRTCLSIITTGHTGYVWRLLVLPNQQVITSSADCTLKLWDFRFPSALTSPRGTETAATAAGSPMIMPSGTSRSSAVSRSALPTPPPVASAARSPAVAVAAPTATSADADLSIQLSLLKRVGQGSFGAVYLAQVLHDLGSRLMAVKVISLARMSATDETKALEEVKLMAQLDHPNVVRLIAAYTHESPDPVCRSETVRSLRIVMEYCAGGSLASLPDVPSTRELREILRQSVFGLAFLHECHPSIQHKDIKPANICLLRPLTGHARDVSVKIVDFGIADEVVSTISMEQGGSQAFWSPERISRQRWNVKDDVWAVGLSILFVGVGLSNTEALNTELRVVGCLPGEEGYKSRLLQLLAHFQRVHGSKLCSILRRLLDPDPSARCSAVEAEELFD